MEAQVGAIRGSDGRRSGKSAKAGHVGQNQCQISGAHLLVDRLTLPLGVAVLDKERRPRGGGRGCREAAGGAGAAVPGERFTELREVSAVRAGIVEAVGELQEESGKSAGLLERVARLGEMRRVLAPVCPTIVGKASMSLEHEAEAGRGLLREAGEHPRLGYPVIAEIELGQREVARIVGEKLRGRCSLRIVRTDPIGVGVSGCADDHASHLVSDLREFSGGCTEILIRMVEIRGNSSYFRPPTRPATSRRTGVACRFCGARPPSFG